MKKTQRGFAVYSSTKDADGNVIRVQQSSFATGRRCWIFANNAKGESAIMHLGQPQSISPHMTPAQARRLAAALLRFADAKP